MPSTPDLLMPPDEAPADTKLGYLQEVLQESEAWLRNQPPWRDIDRAIDIVFNPGNDINWSKSYSKARINSIGIGIDQVTSAISNLRPLWNYKTPNKEDQARRHCRLLNVAMTSTWHTEFMDVAIKRALDHAAIEGTGYLSPQWVSPHWGFGPPKLRLKTFGAKEVFPYMMGSSHDIQDAYIVITKEVVPIVEAWMMYPEARQWIIPDGSSQTYLTKGFNAIRRFVGSLYSLLTRSGNDDTSANGPLVTIFTAYIQDTSLNTGTEVRPMGLPDSSWYYEVPFLNQEIEVGRGPRGPIYEKAGRDECLLYPNRRRVVFTQHCILDDGPSPYWHGKVPVIPVYLKKFPYWFLGASLTHDTAPLQAAMNQLLRNYIDTLEVGLNPPVTYDKTIPKANMERLNLRRPGQKLGVNGTTGEAVKPIMGPSAHRPDSQVATTIQSLRELIGEMLGVNDAKAMLRARQIPGGDSIEKLMEQIGPVQRSRNRRLEESLREVGEQCKWIFFQFYNAPTRMSIYGNDGVLEEDLDWEPDSLIPSHLPGEDPNSPSPTHRFERAREHAKQFTFEVEANSLDQMNQTSRKLMLTNLYKMGGLPFILSPKRIADAYDLHSWGDLEGETDIEQYFHFLITFEKIKAQIAQAGAQGPPGQPGHPQTNRNSPKIKHRPDGSSTTTTGKR